MEIRTKQQGYNLPPATTICIAVVLFVFNVCTRLELQLVTRLAIAWIHAQLQQIDAVEDIKATNSSFIFCRFSCCFVVVRTCGVKMNCIMLVALNALSVIYVMLVVIGSLTLTFIMTVWTFFVSRKKTFVFEQTWKTSIKSMFVVVFAFSIFH